MDTNSCVSAALHSIDLSSLHLRVSHISQSLKSAQDYAAKVGKGMHDEHDNDEDLSTAMSNWELTLAALEECVDEFREACGHPDALDKTVNHLPRFSADAPDDEKLRLLRKIEAQEQKISALECRLDEFRSCTSGQSGEDADDETGLSDTSVNKPAADGKLLFAVHRGETLKFELRNRVTQIGREGGNDVQIRSPYISRYHCRIITDHSDTIIEDLNSRNGLKVNDIRVARKTLRSGDYVTIGQTQLKFLDINDDSGASGQA